MEPVAAPLQSTSVAIDERLIAEGCEITMKEDSEHPLASVTVTV